MTSVGTLRIKKVNLKKTNYWHRVHEKMKKYKSIFWFLFPAAFLSVLFGYLPLIGILIAFKQEYVLAINGPFAELFVKGGWTLSQFTRIFQDEGFFLCLWNTLSINLIKLCIVFPFTIFLAVMLSEVKSTFLAKLLLIILCLPNFLSWSVVIGIWNNFFREVDGVINNILISWNLVDKPIFFFSSEAAFKPFVVFFDMWKGCGWSSILYYTAIMSIDKSYYEAATIDGCSKVGQIVHLTIPSIMPIIALQFVMSITYILSSGFEEIYGLLQVSSPDLRDSMKTLDIYIYEQALGNAADMPFSTALNLFNSTVSLVFMLVGNKICKKCFNRSLW